MNRIAIVLATLALAGCSAERITVSGPATDGVKCTLSNDKGQWSVTAPGEVTVLASKADLSADCTKPGYAPWHAVLHAPYAGKLIDQKMAVDCRPRAACVPWPPEHPDPTICADVMQIPAGCP